MNDKQKRILVRLLIVFIGLIVTVAAVFGGYVWYLAETSPSIIREGDVKELPR